MSVALRRVRRWTPAIGIECESRVHRDRAAGHPVRERDRWPRRDDRAVVGDDRADGNVRTDTGFTARSTIVRALRDEVRETAWSPPDR